MRLPRGIILPGFRVLLPSGEFYSRNQPPVPPGLTISPQADTTCPAALDEINRVGMDVKFFEMKALGAIHPLHSLRGLLAQNLIKRFIRELKTFCAIFYCNYIS